MSRGQLWDVAARLATPVAGSCEIALDALLAVAVGGPAGAERISRSTPVGQLQDLDLPVVSLAHAGETCAIASIASYVDATWAGTSMVRRPDDLDEDLAADKRKRGTGPRRDILRPMTLTCAPQVRWQMLGDGEAAYDLLTRIPSVGSKRAHGWGRVAEWSVQRTRRDAPPTSPIWCSDSLMSRRPLPASWTVWPDHVVRQACRAPYWHPGRLTDAVPAGAQCALSPALTKRIRDCIS